MAATYVQGHNESTLASHQSRNASNTCQYFTHLLASNYHILDAGCGPGTISASLAALVPQGRVTGVDASENVVQKARTQADLPSNCTFQIADILSLPFEDAKFDVVHTSQVLQHLTNPIGALKEFYRVLKPGGFVACREADYHSLIITPEHPGLLKYREVSLAVYIKNGASVKAGRLLPRWCMDAGFKADKTTFTYGSLTYSGIEREQWGTMWTRRVIEDVIWRDRAMAEGLASEEDFLFMCKGWEAFIQDKTAVYVMPCGQIVAYK